MHSFLNLLMVITFKVMEAVLSTFHRLTWIPQSTPVSLVLTMVLHIPDCICHKLQVKAAVLMASLLDRCASGKYNSEKPAPKKIHCKFLFRAKTTQEKVLDGLLGKGEKPLLEICEVPGKGRAVFLRAYRHAIHDYFLTFSLVHFPEEFTKITWFTSTTFTLGSTIFSTIVA